MNLSRIKQRINYAVSTLSNQNKRDVRERVARHMSETLLRSDIERWKKEGDPIGVLHHGILAFEMYEKAGIFRDRDIDLPIDIKILREALNKALGNRIHVYDETYCIGHFIHLLCVFGSSRNQAILAVSEWRRESESKIKAAHVVYKENFYSEDSDIILDLTSSQDVYETYLNKESIKGFPVSPNSYPRVTKACNMLRAIKNDSPDAFWDNDNNFNFEKYKKIKKQILAMCPDIEERGHFEFD